jgi:hypothetical protein
MSNIRFVDSLKVGAYAVDGSVSGIIDNVDHYVLTATGTNEIQGNAQLQFDGANLGIGGPSLGARFEINGTTEFDLMLIQNTNSKGIKVDNKGILSLLEFDTLPTAVVGGIAYHSSDFYLGL